MKILGIGGSLHDYSSCYLEDGHVVCAIEEERLSREKHATGPRSYFMKSIEYCLGNNHLQDLDAIITSDIMFVNHHFNKDILNRIIKINHHIAHAASAYFTSDFNESAVLVVDGCGSYFRPNYREICSWGVARGNQIDIQKRMISKEENIVSINNGSKQFYHSIAMFYQYISESCGFGAFGEGKLMGLAPYGGKRCLSQIRQYIDVSDECEISIDYKAIEAYIHKMFCDAKDSFQLKADLAFAAQAIFEEYIIELMQLVYQKTGMKKLCYSGGAALNIVANHKIKQKAPFEDIYIFPAPGDAGTAVGAALYAYYSLFHHKWHPNKLSNCFLGKQYSDALSQIQKYQSNISYAKMAIPTLLEETARSLAEGKVVGWFQGKAEFGPRALGNRSILADPRRADMKDRINTSIKFREDFRPFAPIVLEDKYWDYFDCQPYDYRFMLFLSQVKQEKAHLIPAVTHIDGSARLQTVSRKNNFLLYGLLEAFERLTGVPVLINTSFNIKGQPIVETPKNALDDFMQSGIDVLILEDYFIYKIF